MNNEEDHQSGQEGESIFRNPTFWAAVSVALLVGSTVFWYLGSQDEARKRAVVPATVPGAVTQTNVLLPPPVPAK